MLAFLEENTLLCAPVSELGADEKCKFTEPGRAVPSEIHAIAKSITQHCKDAEAAIVLIRSVPDIADIAEGKADIRIIWREFGDNIADDLLRLGGRHRAFFDLFVVDLLGNDVLIFKSDVAAERRQQREIEPGRARAQDRKSVV